MKFFIKQKNRGFTLVETLVAVSIFSVSIVTMLVVLGQGLSDTTYAKKKITAGYLAQEGIEYIRNMRDTYVLFSSSSAVGWTTFMNGKMLASCTGAYNGCYFKADDLFSQTSPERITDMPVTGCASSCPNLLYDSDTGRYGYNSGTASGFIRKISVEQVSANELKVSSTVYWQQGSGTYNITLTENLFNWVE